MIDEEATFKKFDYYSTDLSKSSEKRVITICKECGKNREIRFNAYHSLCKSCAIKKRWSLPKPKFVKEVNRFISGTGIDRIETIKKFGYDPINLKFKSYKFIIVKCKNCGKNRILKKNEVIMIYVNHVHINIRINYQNLNLYQKKIDLFLIPKLIVY